MDEKTLVSDALVGINGELKMFGDMIPQTENKELKQCLKQIRNQCEMSQEKMYTAAREKSYYVPAEKASNAGNRTCQIYFKRKISQFRVQAIKNCRLNPDPTIEPTFIRYIFNRLRSSVMDDSTTLHNLLVVSTFPLHFP